MVEARLAEPGYSARTPQHRLDQERQFRNELLAQIETARREFAEQVQPIPGGLPAREVGTWAPLPLFEKSLEAEEANLPPFEVVPEEVPDRAAIEEAVFQMLRVHPPRRSELVELARRWRGDRELRRLLAAALRTTGRWFVADKIDGPLRKVVGHERTLPPTPFLTNATELPDEFDGLTDTQRMVLGVMREAAPPGRPFMRLNELAAEVAIREPSCELPRLEQMLIALGHPSLRRIPLVELQGFSGRFTPDATHLTHARLTREGLEVLNQTLAVPLLLINGAEGHHACVPPHHPTELIRGCLRLLQLPIAALNDLRPMLIAPDFPDGGVIYHSGTGTLWRNGHGKLVARGTIRLEIDDRSRRARIVVEGLPWPLSSAAVRQELIELRGNGLLDGVSAILDHSSATSSKVVVELEHLAFCAQVNDAILKSKASELSWDAEFRVRGVPNPRVLDLEDMLRAFVEHRREVAVKKLDRAVIAARLRAQNAEAIAVALALLEPVLTVMRAADEDEQAVTALMNFMRPEYRDALTSLPFPASHDYAKGFTESQARHVVATRKLASRRPDSVRQDWAALLAATEEARALLSDRHEILGVVRRELTEALERFDQPRRTELVS